jgi:hypothetical protein
MKNFGVLEAQIHYSIAGFIEAFHRPCNIAKNRFTEY